MASKRAIDPTHARLTLYVMPRGTFNLIRAISNLLREIGKFRKKLKASRKFAREFRVANARYNAAFEKQSEMLRAPLPEEQPARRVAEVQRNQQFSKVEKLRQKNDNRWKLYTASTGFIGVFLGKVELVLQRLPLTPQWRPFPDEIRRLRIGALGSWVKMPPNRDLETLEIRLKGMVDLARASANKAGSRLLQAPPTGVPSPTPGSATRGQIKAPPAPGGPSAIESKGPAAKLRLATASREPSAKAAPAQTRLAARLKKLKDESKLTWDTIAKEMHVSRRWLLDIAAGESPSKETRKTISDYFAGILKRPVRL